MPRPFPKKISQIKPTLTNVALTNHYSVEFGLHQYDLREYLKKRGLDSRYITESIGLLCSRAQLPGSGLATADIVGNYQGVSEKMAHSRLFTRMSMEFYVDTGYRSLKFLEHWMEYIASGSTTGRDRIATTDERYYFRMRYPEEYKSDETRIIKFERDYKRYIEYRFWGLFPISLDSTTVSYEGTNLLKATASFHFDRYISGQSRSLNISQGTDGNKDQPPTGTGQANNNPTDSQQQASVYGNYSLGSANYLNNDLGIELKGKINNIDWMTGGSVLSDGQIANSAISQRQI